MRQASRDVNHTALVYAYKGVLYVFSKVQPSLPT